MYILFHRVLLGFYLPEWNMPSQVITPHFPLISFRPWKLTFLHEYRRRDTFREVRNREKHHSKEKSA
jgi:hypothetical protein